MAVEFIFTTHYMALSRYLYSPITYHVLCNTAAATPTTTTMKFGLLRKDDSHSRESIL